MGHKTRNRRRQQQAKKALSDGLFFKGHKPGSASDEHLNSAVTLAILPRASVCLLSEPDILVVRFPLPLDLPNPLRFS